MESVGPETWVKRGSNVPAAEEVDPDEARITLQRVHAGRVQFPVLSPAGEVGIAVDVPEGSVHVAGDPAPVAHAAGPLGAAL